MTFPPLAPFPDGGLRGLFQVREWEACLEAWESVIQFYLVLPSRTLTAALTMEPCTLIDFLLSYVQQPSHEVTYIGKKLRRSCFILTHRILSEMETSPKPLLNLRFLGDLSVAYTHTIKLNGLIDSIWTRSCLETKPESIDCKITLMQVLNGSPARVHGDADVVLSRTLALLRVSHNYGGFLMVGADLLDALITGWENQPSRLQRKVTTISYYSLMSLAHGKRQNTSLLLDHLYSLKAKSESSRTDTEVRSLLVDLVTTTPFLRKLQRRIPGSGTGRLGAALLNLDSNEVTFGTQSRHNFQRKRKSVERLHAGSSHGRASSQNLYIHRASLVTQIQDVFPQLSIPLALSLLDKYNNNPDQVIAYLLENPSHLLTGNHIQRP